jgi:phage N-6-adenine-methyltransferase
MNRTGASFARGVSKQDYATPRVFLNEVRRRFGPIWWDLAAISTNCVVGPVSLRFYGPGSPHGENSLAQKWQTIDGNLWLNPPFDRIGPWAQKCADTPCGKGRRILLLVPAAVGSNWWRDHVHGTARVLFLNGRLSFDGKNPYPKDCALCVYGEPHGYEIWSWRVCGVHEGDDPTGKEKCICGTDQ